MFEIYNEIEVTVDEYYSFGRLEKNVGNIYKHSF